ncbi:MAG: FHA domain-containing protein [Gemmatimonadota bacterium]
MPALGEAAGPVLAVLRVRSGIGGSGEYPIRSFTTRIGRAPGNDVVLVAPTVAPEHARLSLQEGLWSLQAYAGTVVDGQQVEESGWLAPGSDIRLGEVRLAFDPRDQWVASPELADAPGELEPSGTLAVPTPAPEHLLQYHEASSPFLILPESEPDSRRVWLIAAIVTVAIVALTYFLLQAS